MNPTKPTTQICEEFPEDWEERVAEEQNLDPEPGTSTIDCVNRAMAMIREIQTFCTDRNLKDLFLPPRELES